jgi:hypothetical protein
VAKLSLWGPIRMQENVSGVNIDIMTPIGLGATRTSKILIGVHKPPENAVQSALGGLGLGSRLIDVSPDTVQLLASITPLPHGG